MWTVVVRQGTGGVKNYKTLDQVRKNASKLMSMRTRGANEHHKYIEVYNGKFDSLGLYQKPQYVINYYGLFESNPDNLIMYNSSNKCIGWIENGIWTSKESGKSRRL